MEIISTKKKIMKSAHEKIRKEIEDIKMGDLSGNYPEEYPNELKSYLDGLERALEIIGPEPQPDPEPVPGKWYWVTYDENGETLPAQYLVDVNSEDGYADHYFASSLKDKDIDDVHHWNPYPIQMPEEA